MQNIDGQAVLEKIRKYVAPNYAPYRFIPIKAEGVWLEGWLEGKGNYRVMDLTSTYSALSLGHNAKEIVDLKVARLLEKKPSKTSRGIVSDSDLADFAEFLCKLSGMDMMIPKNGGTEAFDTAVHAARMWKWKAGGGLKDGTNIIVCERNFHGRSGLARDASSENLYRDGFGPYAINSFKKIPFGDLAALESAITPMTAAFMPEPVQCEGGMIFPPHGYLKGARKICREHNVLFILDEIQTGLGRTGKLFAWEHEGEDARPDGMLLGKAIGGGEDKLSVFVGRRDVLEVLSVGLDGSTFGGDPSSCAIGKRALELLSDPALLSRVTKTGAWFMRKLKTIDSPLVKDIRGKGLLIGIELGLSSENMRKICEQLLDVGVLTKDTHGVIRITPPLVVSRKELEWAEVCPGKS